MEPILRTEHLTFTYPGEEQPTLGDLSLEIARGSFVAVLGHNGSGKSTLAKHLQRHPAADRRQGVCRWHGHGGREQPPVRARHGGHGLSESR
ncbi:MAG: ATP-binding cassette domain-containing protein [Oscillospiraceae bacterium]